MVVAAATAATATGRSGFGGTDSSVTGRTAISCRVGIGRDAQLSVNRLTTTHGALFRLTIPADEFLKVFLAVVAYVLVNWHKGFPSMNKNKRHSFSIIPFLEKKKRMKWKDFKIFTKFSKKSEFPLQKTEMKCNIEVGSKMT